jgi:hypothetical protein
MEYFWAGFATQYILTSLLLKARRTFQIFYFLLLLFFVFSLNICLLIGLLLLIIVV